MTPSQQTLSTLYRRYHRQIRAYLSRMTGDAQEAEDLTQEVFVKACRQLAGERRGDNMRAWLFQVATYTCFDHHRRSKRRVREAPIPDDMQLTSTGDPFEQAQSTAAVVASLRRLAERHRAVLILKDVNGFRHAEIAAAMGISEGAAQILLHRARAEFKTAYTEVVAGRTTSCPVADRVAQDLSGHHPHARPDGATSRDTRRPARVPRTAERTEGSDRRARIPPRAAAGPDVGLPFIPPALPLPPAPPAFDITMGLHGLLPQVMQTLSSKAAAVVVSAALVVGGQLATESVVPRGAVNDRAAITTVVTQPRTVEAGAPAGGTHDNATPDTLWGPGPEAVRGQTLTDDWHAWRAQEDLRLETDPHDLCGAEPGDGFREPDRASSRTPREQRRGERPPARLYPLPPRFRRIRDTPRPDPHPRQGSPPVPASEHRPEHLGGRGSDLSQTGRPGPRRAPTRARSAGHQPVDGQRTPDQGLYLRPPAPIRPRLPREARDDGRTSRGGMSARSEVNP